MADSPSKTDAENVPSLPRPETGGRGRGRASTRLTVDDWIDAAFELIVREGVAAVRSARLCETLGVTKGSFYWHFSDISQLIEATAERWCAAQNDVVRGLDKIDSMPVAERLERMASILVERTWVVEVAVREWARTNEKVAASVRALDRRIFKIIYDALRELGFDTQQARIRAGALTFAGIGFVHGRDSLPTPTAAELRAMFTLFTQTQAPSTSPQPDST
ncbi:TetR/AcrR family transcriptional regulator [Skermania sp. ID1734]|uniref:TetR/AcrR family transcriptional regulator n=1 Tax=Skermania sp. ID1734 TaxID=2597516 RepID=UPI0011806703|nr:TetR/AcrR family transcriptional regulator [Skermania sp. ID1734]TSE00617.1 TetR/AcrR family transcriptional regulator [Skermania sp. ID1734]